MPDVDRVVIKLASGKLLQPPRDQERTFAYLSQLVDDDEQSALSKVLTEMFNGGGKATADYLEDGKAVWHSSKGVVGVAGITIFYTVDAGQATIFAMGHHVEGSKPVSYRVDVYGQPEGDFTYNELIVLKKKK